MIKKILFLTLFVLIIVIGFHMLYNGFSNIDSITIQKYDEPYNKGETITEKGKKDTIQGILNRANHLPSKMEYKIAGKPVYQMELKYEDKSSEVLDILENFEHNKTLLISDKGDRYEINERETKEIIQLLLN